MTEKPNKFTKVAHQLASSYYLLLGVTATVASISVLLKYLLADSTPQTVKSVALGVTGTIAGAVIGYLFTRARRLVSDTQPAVFVSYSHGDSDFVKKLAENLKEADVRPIVDRFELKVGDDIRSAVNRLIDRSDYVLIVVSESSSKSDWAAKEIDQAVKRNKKVLPVVLNVGAVPEALSGIYYADFTGDFELGMEQLKRTLNPKLDNKIK